MDNMTNEENIKGLPKIHGWVARDNDLNHIHLFSDKPLRDRYEWASGSYPLTLPNEMFPDLTWESEPVEVELLIKKI